MPIAVHSTEKPSHLRNHFRELLVSKDKVQKHVNVTITHRHPQFVLFGDPVGELTVSIETLWKSFSQASSQLFHFQVQTKRPSNKTSCHFHLSATAGQ